MESEVAYVKELRKRAYAKGLRRAVVTFILMLDVEMDRRMVEYRSSPFYTRPTRARSIDRSIDVEDMIN